MRVSQQRLSNQNHPIKKENTVEFNKLLLAKLQENFLATPDNAFDKIYKTDETKKDQVQQSYAKENLTDVITKGYETQIIRELDLDEIINTNNASDDIAPEKLDDFVKNVTSKILKKKNLAYQPSFTWFMKKNIDVEQVTQIAD